MIKTINGSILITTILLLLHTNALADINLSYAQRSFDYSADYAGAKAKGDGEIQELGFYYGDKEYFQIMGMLQESDEKQDALLGIIIGDFWVEYSTGDYEFTVEPDASYVSQDFSEKVKTEYERIDLYWSFTEDRNCVGDIFGNEICRSRTGISYLNYTAPVDISYQPYGSTSTLDEQSFLAAEAEFTSIGMGGTIEFEPHSFGVYRKFATHLGMAEASYSNIQTLCCSDEAANNANSLEGDTSDLLWLADYYLAVGLALNVPLGSNGSRVLGSVSYDIQGAYTLPFLLVDGLEDLDEGESRMEMLSHSWQGIRLGLNVIF